MAGVSFGSGKDPNRKSLSAQLREGTPVAHLSRPDRNPSILYRQSLHGPFKRKHSPLSSLRQGLPDNQGIKMSKLSSVNHDYVLEGLKYAGASLHKDFMEKRANMLPLSWFGGNKLTGLGAIIGGLAPALKQVDHLRGLAKDPAAALKVRGIADDAAKLEAQAAAAGTKFKPSWEQRVAGRDVKFLDAVKGKNWKDNPMDMLKAYLPQVGSQGLQGAALGGAAGKLGDTLLAMYKRKKFMDTAKKVAVPAAAGLGAYALLKD